VPDPAFLSTVAQLIGVLLVATLIWPLTRVIRQRFLDYWAVGWAAQAVALLALFASNRAAADLVPLFRSAYCLFGYGFAYLVWVGCRAVTGGRAVRRTDVLWLAGPAAFGLVVPWLNPTRAALFGWHAGILAVLFLAAVCESSRYRPAGPAVGRRAFQASLFGLTVLFAHYAAVVGWMHAAGEVARLPYLAYSSLYDALLQVGLAFGMITLAAERMRAELEEANARLAAAAAELETVARTDPLTGLLNRRALDDLLARPPRVRPGCLAVIDVNDLKPLNDRHGHEAGDIALQLVARGIRNLFRVTDPLFRLGGDEFLVLMPGGSAEELVRRLESLDRGLVGHRLSGVAHPLDLRVAWGVAGYADAAGVPAALKQADDAMYAQKKQRKGGSER
jgi:diguanylate cyclase (GGDEF)-like protein